MGIVTNAECVLPRPDIGELHSQFTVEFSKRLLGGAPVLPNSTEDVLSFVMAGATNLFYGAVSQALRENDPSTMCCDNLIVYGATHGINLRAAVRAKGYVVLSGTPGTPIPATLRLVGTRSHEYKLDVGTTTNPTALDSTGHASVRIVAALAGVAFNVPAGITLAVATTFPGLNMEATIVGNGLTGGDDDEDCDVYRERIIEAERTDVITTNEAWYLRESAYYPGVTRVCTDECQGCCDPTNVLLYPFFEGVYGDAVTPPYGVPPDCGVLQEMTDWMFGPEPGRGKGKAPIAVRGAYLQAHPTPINIVARCVAGGCPIGAEERLKAALAAYLRSSFCVGSTICKEQVRAALYRALGVDVCFSDITLSYGPGVRFQDASNIYLDCGFFAVAGEVTLSASYQ